MIVKVCIQCGTFFFFILVYGFFAFLTYILEINNFNILAVNDFIVEQGKRARIIDSHLATILLLAL